MILDAHVHLPCHDAGLVTFEEKKEALLKDIQKAEVDGVIVISDSESSSLIGTPDDCVALFANIGHVFVMGGISPLIEYEVRLARLDALLAEKKVIALKLYPGHEAFYIDDPKLDAAYDLCEKYRVPMAVHTGWDNPQYSRPHLFCELAKRRPSLRIVICHLCWPDLDLCYEATADCPNVFYDISSLAHDTGLLERTRQSLNRIAQDSSQRILLGSDYGACSMEAHIALVRSLKISQQAKQRILYDNAADLYNIHLS